MPTLHMPALHMPNLLELNNACIGYDQQVIVENANLVVNAGDWITLLGPNGSGKTTLLKALLGTLPLVSGNRIPGFNKAGYVPQRITLSIQSPMKVHEFLLLNPFHKQCKPAYHRALLEDLMLSPLLEQHIQSLSGGQLQRVVLAYALCGDPDILFLDEFLDSFDCESNIRVLNTLSDRHKNGLTIVEVSHNISTVIEYANRAVLVQRQILFDGKPRDEGLKEQFLFAHQHHHWASHA